MWTNRRLSSFSKETFVSLSAAATLFEPELCFSLSILGCAGEVHISEVTAKFLAGEYPLRAGDDVNGRLDVLLILSFRNVMEE